MCAMITLVLFSLVSNINSFNLEERQAVLFSGETNTSFGFTVALWPGAPSVYRRVVVGSPAATGSVGGVTGKVIFCNHDNGLCEGHADLSLLQRDFRNELILAKDNSGMDFSVGFSETILSTHTTNQLLVCAPRFPLYFTHEREVLFRAVYPRGGCLLFGPQTNGAQTIVPVQEKIINEHNRLFQNTIRFTGASECGFSAAEQADGGFIMGAPQAYFGQGTPFMRTSRGVLDQLSIHGPKTSDKDFQYEFWATVSAQFGGNIETVAASAPNALEMIGTVRFYRITSTRLTERQSRSGARLTGSSVGSMFGYSLAAGDLDGDGVHDLVVGEPYYTDDGPSRSSLDAGPRSSTSSAGVVHVVYAPLDQSVERASLLLHNPEGAGHYGLSVLCPKDLDLDGYDDIVIGAPDDDHGKVFIYNGSPEGLNSRPSQILHGRKFLQLPSGSPGGRFGFSLAGGHDVDNNHNPDLLIGAVAADKAVLFRSATVLTVMGEVRFSPSVVVLGRGSCPRVVPGSTTNTCFLLELDLKYNSTVYRRDIDVEVDITLDAALIHGRTLFLSNGRNREKMNLTISHIELSRNRGPQRLQLYLTGDRPNLKELVMAHISISLGQKSAPRQFDPVQPILQGTEFETTARLTCPDQSCYKQAELFLNIDQGPLIVGSGPHEMKVNIRTAATAAYQVVLTVNYRSLLSYSHVSGTSVVPSCSYSFSSSNDTQKLVCDVVNAIRENKQVSFSVFFDYQPIKLLEVVETLNSPPVFLYFSANSDHNIENKNNRKRVSISPSVERELVLSGESNPEQVRVLQNQTLARSEVLGLYYSANSSATSVTKLGPEVIHSYTLHNLGPSPVLQDQLLIEWPLQYEFPDGGYLPVMYIAESPVPTGPVKCSSPAPNPLGLHIPEIEEEMDDIALDYDSYLSEGSSFNSSETEKDRRVKRDALSENLVAEEDTGQTEENTLTCDLMQCYTIRCNISELPSGGTVHVHIISYLTVADLPQNVSAVSSRAVLHNTGQERSIRTRVNVIAPPITGLGLLFGYWWIPALALLAGVLLVLLLVIILYKCGFFKRAKKKDLQRLRASQRQRHSQLAPKLSKAEEKEMEQLYVKEQLAQSNVHVS